jgi:hypothetical protein
MCGGDKSCSSCSANKKSPLHTLPAGYVRTRVFFYSADGSQVGGDNSAIRFNLARPVNSVVGIEWVNNDIWYQLAAQPALVSIDELPNPGYSTSGVSYFAVLQSANNNAPPKFQSSEQPPRSYAQVTIRVNDKTGTPITSLTPWFLELEFIQKVNN